MSSKYVRDQVKSHIQTNLPLETLIDFSAEYREMGKLLTDTSLGPRDPFLGIQFVPSDYSPNAIVTNNQGGFIRERGAFLLHVVEATEINPADKTDKLHLTKILDRSDALLALFQGARINNDIYVEGIVPANFEASVTLQFERGYESAATIVNFYYDKKY